MHALKRFALLAWLLWLPACFTPGALTNMRESERRVTIGLHRAWLAPEGGLEIALQAECEDESWQAAWISISRDELERAFAGPASLRGAPVVFELPPSALREGMAAKELVPAENLVALYIVRPGPGDYEPENMVDTGLAVRDFEGKLDYMRGQRVSFELVRQGSQPALLEERRFSIVLAGPDGMGSERPGNACLVPAITGDVLLLGEK